MIVGHGIDVVKKSRIQKIFSKYGKKFAYKILNTQEMKDFLRYIDFQMVRLLSQTMLCS